MTPTRTIMIAHGSAAVKAARIIAAVDREKRARCPKCSALSGDDWSQCRGDCPMPMSPHYIAPTAAP